MKQNKTRKKIYSYLLVSLSFIFLFSFSVYAFDGVVISVPDGAVIQAEFTDLNDTPNNYTGSADLCLIVNDSETGVRFGNCSDASGSGDITAVNTNGIYLIGGESSGAVSLLLNDTVLNTTINSLIDLDEFHYNMTIGGGGSGDITAVLTPGSYLTGGASSGDVTLRLNYTIINTTINELIDADEFHYNFTDTISSSTDYTNLALTNESETWDSGLNITLQNRGWFFGLFNIVVSSQYASFNGSTLTIDDTKLNNDFNQTSYIDGVNTTANIEGLGFVTGAHTVDTNETTRVNNMFANCSTGNFIFGRELNGTPICDAPAGGGDITAVNTDGIYLTGGAASGDVSLLLDDTVLNTTINSLIDLDEFHYNFTGTFVDTDTTYINGTGLSLIGTEFNLSTTFTDTLYAGIEFDYNQTINSAFDYNMTIDSPFDYNQTGEFNYNQTDIYTNGTGILLIDNQFNVSEDYLNTLYTGIEFNYNQTIDSAFDYNMTLNLFDQDLNQNDDVRFNSVNSTTNITSDMYCLNPACTSFIYNNGSDSIWV